MSQISSINFKKSNYFQTQHNDRKKPPNYRIKDNDSVWYDRDSSEALAEKNRIINEAIEKYESRVKQRFQAKSYEWSAVVNLKADSTMEDLERLSEHFKKNYGFQCYQIAMHHDEGHINEKGEEIINYHAHLEFITLDKETGKNLWNRTNISPKILRKMQDEVAEILGMERGQDKRLSGVQRIEPRIYAKMKEQEKTEMLAISKKAESLEKENTQLRADLSIKEALNYVEKWRNWSKGKFTNEFYNGENGINAIKRRIKGTKGNIDKAELRKEIRNLIKTSPRKTTQTPPQTKDNTAELVAKSNNTNTAQTTQDTQTIEKLQARIKELEGGKEDLRREGDSAVVRNGEILEGKKEANPPQEAHSNLEKENAQLRQELEIYKSFPKDTIDTYRVAIVREMKFDYPNADECLVKAFELETKKDEKYIDYFKNPSKISEYCLNLAKKMIENYKQKFGNFLKNRDNIKTNSR